jgi:hypothetical protein
MSTPSVDVRGRCATRDAGAVRVGRPGRGWRLLAPGIVRATLRHQPGELARRVYEGEAYYTITWIVTHFLSEIFDQPR